MSSQKNARYNDFELFKTCGVPVQLWRRILLND